jgi:hypothetical protein
MLRILFLLLLSSSLFSLERREVARPMTISIIIPCHYKHFALLPELLRYYSEQDTWPNEVIICLTASQRKFIADDLIESVLEGPFPFSIKMIEDAHDLPGENRNAACKASIGDILICQDADDLPHPQRLYFIKYLFETYKVDFLMHRLFFNEGSFPPYSQQEIVNRSQYFQDYDSIVRLYGSTQNGTHNGTIVITRAVFDQIQWPHLYNGEDMAFNREVFSHNEFYKVVTDAHLILYRNHLSSYKNRNE